MFEIDNATIKRNLHTHRLLNVTDALATLHWLRVPERVQYKIAVLTYKVLHDNAPRYLGPLVAMVDLPARRALRLASTSRLVIPPIKLFTVGIRCWLSGYCSSSLKRSARGRHLIVITAVFPASTKDSFNYRIHTWFSDCLSGIVIVVLVVTLLFRPL